MFKVLIFVVLFTAALNQTTNMGASSTDSASVQLANIQRIKQMSAQQKKYREVYAILSGYLFTFSSVFITQGYYNKPQLDNYYPASTYACWAPQPNPPTGQWAQAHSPGVQYWTDVVVQGRGGLNQWVKSYKVKYSQDLVNWKDVDDGRIFTGSSDSSTKVRGIFNTPVYGRAIRVYPQTWNNYIAMRFDGIFINLTK